MVKNGSKANGWEPFLLVNLITLIVSSGTMRIAALCE